MQLYEELDPYYWELVEDLVDEGQLLDWRGRHRLFMTLAGRILDRCNNRFADDSQMAHDVAYHTLSLCVTAALDALGVEDCVDEWCAGYLIHSARQDHRQLGTDWALAHPAEWAMVEREVTGAIAH